MNTKVVKHETLAAETTPQIHQSVPFRLIFAGSKSAPGKHQQRHRRRQPIAPPIFSAEGATRLKPWVGGAEPARHLS